MENAQRTSFFPEGAKVGFASCLLMDQALVWWEEVEGALGYVVVVAMTWEEFVMRFQDEFAPTIEVQLLEREFQDPRQTTKTVAEITAKFRERGLLVPHYATDKDMKKVRYHDMLRDDIREFVSLLGFKTLNDMIARARK